MKPIFKDKWKSNWGYYAISGFCPYRYEVDTIIGTMPFFCMLPKGHKGEHEPSSQVGGPNGGLKALKLADRNINKNSFGDYVGQLRKILV